MISHGRLAAGVVCFVVCLASVLSVTETGARAQDRRQSAPGKFDFYVLSLSWSPSYCAATSERRTRRRRSDPQCGARPFSFVVHGLWPQYQQGFPEYCQVPAPRLNRNIVGAMLDLMPSPGLIFHEWDRHGVCSGLSPGRYFAEIRKARAVVKIPEQYMDPTTTLSVTPDEVEEAFVKANAGLSRAGIAVRCDRRRLREVRICLSRELTFQDCPEVDRRACRREHLLMPPVRGGNSNAGRNERERWQ